MLPLLLVADPVVLVVNLSMCFSKFMQLLSQPLVLKRVQVEDYVRMVVLETQLFGTT